MDFNLKQWRDQHDNESDQQQQQPSVAKMPKLLLDHHHQQQQQQQHSTDSYTALPLFVPEPNSAACHKISNLSAFPDHSTSANTNSPRFPRMESYFSLAQIQELELQAMIYRYMREGAAVPPELLQPIKKSLLYSTPYFLHPSLSQYSYCQPTLFQTGYWGRGAMDPEPGRCRRTDGKKWRCSRDVVAGQKYCERHVHRGRNRSRKPVEIPTPSSTTTTTATGSGNGSVAAAGSMFNSSSTTGSAPAAMVNGTNISLSRQSHDSIDLLHLNNSCSDSKTESKGLLGPTTRNDHVGDKPDGHVLRHFFDDWPRRSLQEPDSNAGSNASSATCLSISMPGNSSSDVSLKLSTGNGEDEPAGDPEGNEREQPMLNWGGSGWGTNQVSSMAGPLAEALRLSVSNSSPTSVLHQLPRVSASEASYVST